MNYVAISKKNTPHGEVIICTSLREVSRFTGISWHTLRYQFGRLGRDYYTSPPNFSEVWVGGDVIKQSRPQYQNNHLWKQGST